MKSLIRLTFSLFIIVGIILICFDLIYSNKILNEKNKKITVYFNKTPVVDIKFNKPRIKHDSNNYIGIVEIPKIRLKGGFVNPLSIHNNIDENITILKPIMMPNENNSVFILAAHSGNSHISFFGKLHKLDINDIIYIYFNNKTYEYKVVKHYLEEKNGLINIRDSSNNKKLILTTCDSFNKQLVYVAYLFKVE